MTITIVKDAIAAFVKAHPKQWLVDRSDTVGSSEIGRCARKTFALKHDDDSDPALHVQRNPEEQSWGGMERGNTLERHLLAPAIKHVYSERAHLCGDEQVTFVDRALSTTPDCLIMQDAASGGPFMIEFKTLDPRVPIDSLPRPADVAQCQVQMGVLRAKGVARPAYTILAYVDASFVDETNEFCIEYDPQMYETAQARAHEILATTNFADLKPEGWIAGGKECERCPYSLACGRSRTAVPADDELKKADPQFVAEISDLAVAYKAQAKAIETAEEAQRALRYRITGRLRDKKVKKVVGNGVSVSWSAVKGRDHVDLNAMRADGIAVDDYTTSGEPGDRLTVTLKKLIEPITTGAAEPSRASHYS